MIEEKSDTEESSCSLHESSQVGWSSDAEYTEHSSLYKYRGRTLELSQQERREKFLEEQKEKRHTVADSNRHLLEFFIQQPYEDEEEMEIEEISQRKTRKRRFFSNLVLMQSEWFTEIPDDLEENWLVKFVPQGFRVMLVTRGRKTVLYDSHLKSIRTIKSNFPGGGGIDKSLGQTILDCVFSAATNTIFVLDCLCWNKVIMLDTESKFRLLWLRSKFDEDPNLRKCIKYRFLNLIEVPAYKPLIQDEMSHVFLLDDDKYHYDGIVFYHKEAYYTLGKTPLVGWLASYMLPEMLSVDVAPENMVKKPKDYQGIHDYINKKEMQKLEKPRKSKKKKNQKQNMDIS